MTDPKQVILARRARFVAAALASVSLAACGSNSETGSTVDAKVDGTGVVETGPVPCLDQAPPPDSSTVDTATSDTKDAGDAKDAADTAVDDGATDDTGPAACLKFAPDTSGD